MYVHIFTHTYNRQTHRGQAEELESAPQTHQHLHILTQPLTTRDSKYNGINRRRGGGGGAAFRRRGAGAHIRVCVCTVPQARACVRVWGRPVCWCVQGSRCEALKSCGLGDMVECGVGDMATCSVGHMALQDAQLESYGSMWHRRLSCCTAEVICLYVAMPMHASRGTAFVQHCHVALQQSCGTGRFSA